jgi:hypothetical protein
VEEGKILSVDVFEAVRDGRIVRVPVVVKVGDPLEIIVEVRLGETITVGTGVSVTGWKGVRLGGGVSVSEGVMVEVGGRK